MTGVFWKRVRRRPSGSITLAATGMLDRMASGGAGAPASAGLGAAAGGEAAPGPGPTSAWVVTVRRKLACGVAGARVAGCGRAGTAVRQGS
jgi:hypothetical protein